MLVWSINKEKYATIFNREWNCWPCASIVNIINSPFILFHRISIFREDRPYSLRIIHPSENKTKVTIFLHRGCQAAIPFLCKRGTRSWTHKNWEWRYYFTDTVVKLIFDLWCCTSKMFQLCEISDKGFMVNQHSKRVTKPKFAL